MKQVKTFKQLFENKDVDENNTDFIISRLNTKISNTKKNIQTETALIYDTENALEKKWICIYNNSNYPRINADVDYDDFKEKHNYFGGNKERLRSFYDPYDNLMESSIDLYENYIVCNYKRDYVIYVTEEENLRLKIKEYDI